MNDSFWWNSLPEWQYRDAIQSDESADLIIVGAGYTGLWTAFFVKQKLPSLNIVVVESAHVGYGASGRNGGWVSSFWPVPLTKIAKELGEATASKLQGLLHELIDDFEHTLKINALDADFSKSGTFTFARSSAQLQRIKIEVDTYRKFGFDENSYKLISEDDRLPKVAGALAALYSPHCASIHPAKLVRSLATKVESMGVRIFERSPVSNIGNRFVMANNFKVEAEHILLATEGYGHQLLPRVTAPIHSLMFATSPIPVALFDSVNLSTGVTFSDARNLVIYGQRTSDNRIAFGGRGAPYRMGSRTGVDVELHQPAFNYLTQTASNLFPELADYFAAPESFWGGPIGVARDWQPSIEYDQNTGFIRAGNYVGDGVAAAFLAGKTIADLLAQDATAITKLPWVSHKSRRWEIEPVRYFLINFARIAVATSDKLEQSSAKTSRITSWLWRLLKG